MKALKIFLLSAPIWVVMVCMTLPTFDDWTYFTSPWFITRWQLNLADAFMPCEGYWRPFDMLFGYLLSFSHQAFPIANHLMVCAAHIANAAIVCHLARRLMGSERAGNVAVTFFVLSPAMLCTVMGIDALNQAWSALFGLLSVEAWLFVQGRRRVVVWLACIVMATFWKENGIAFAVIGPLLAWGWGRESNRQLLHSWVVAGLICVAYFALRHALHNDNVVDRPDYFDFSIVRRVKNVAIFYGLTFLPLDYVSLATPQQRNIPVVIITALLASPFVYFLAWRCRGKMRSRQLLALAVSMLAAASPHLLTVFTTMHAYAALPFVALALGWMAHHAEPTPWLRRLCLCFIVTCLFIDVHHWNEAYKSGLTGKKMANEGVSELVSNGADRTDSVYILSVYEDAVKYSAFTVIPADAFAWGFSLMGHTDGSWPTCINDTSVMYLNPALQDSVTDKARGRGFKHMLLVRGDSVRYQSLTK